MATRNPARRSNAARRARRSGVTSFQMLVLLVPVFFGFMGFAVDLGRLYMIRGELKTAADSMALAAARELIGTDTATTNATSAAERSRLEAGGFQNRFDFGSRQVGESEGNLASTVVDPQYYESVGEATGAEDAAGTGDGIMRHVRVEVTAEAPLMFWRFLAQGQEGRTEIRARAVAGISAPLCTACGIEPIVVAALDTEDVDNFGFVAQTRYTLGHACTGPNQPQPLAGSTQRIAYLFANRLNADAQALTDEATQIARIGGGGLPPSPSQAVSCLAVNAVETVWEGATPLACPAPANPAQIPAVARSFLCGLATRFETGVFAGCETIPEVDAALGAFAADTDVADLEDYAAYTGNGRRVITIAIADSIADPQAMTILGFRQFLLTQVGTNLNPTDQTARFTALYIGSVVPLKQGRFGGCAATAGPGKVVLHQ